MSGFSLQGFEMMGCLGKGGMAEVWKARQLSLDRIVAIKFLTNQSLPDQEARERFKTEAQAAAKLNHPGIVQVYDAGEQDGVPYFVMEYVEGLTLADALDAHRKFTEENALIIAECIALALGHAWEKARMVHCDIKPENILLANDGSIKVADLGLARIVDRKPAGEETVLGTPNYTSPEQASGEPDLDCRADIYSLGAMLYHLVTGRLPFQESKGSSAMDEQIHGYLADPIELREDLSHPTAWLIEKFMVKDRLHRVATWDAALADIRAVQKKRMPGAPFPAPGESTVLRSAKRRDIPPPLISTPKRATPVIVSEPTAKKIVVSKAALDELQPQSRAAYSLSTATITMIMLLLAVGATYAYLFLGAKPAVIEPAPEPAPPLPSSIRVLPPEEVKKWSAPIPAPEPPPEPIVEPPEPAAPDPAPEPSVPSRKADGTITWKDPDFLKAVELYNASLEKYVTFQRTRANRGVLDEIEQNCREAIRLFETAAPRAPADLDLKPIIADCTHLLQDTRQSQHIKRK